MQHINIRIILLIFCAVGQVLSATIQLPNTRTANGDTDAPRLGKRNDNDDELRIEYIQRSKGIIDQTTDPMIHMFSIIAHRAEEWGREANLAERQREADKVFEQLRKVRARIQRLKQFQEAVSS